MKKPYFNKEERGLIYLNTLKSDLMLAELARKQFCKILYKQTKTYLEIIFNVLSFLLFYLFIIVWIPIDAALSNLKKLIQ